MEMKNENRICTPQQLRTHAYELAGAFHIVLDLSDNCPPDMAIAGNLRGFLSPIKMVRAREVTDETSYAVVMHEMDIISHPTVG